MKFRTIISAVFVIIAFTFIMKNSHAKLSKEYIDYQLKCLKAKGTWMLLPTTCQDLCTPPGKEPKCVKTLTWGCLCGKGKCWNGNKCQKSD